MNTLSKDITSYILGSDDAYDKLRTHWSILVNDKNSRRSLTNAHHLLYAALCGKDWRKGFTPITNKVTLENGGHYNWDLWDALNGVTNPWGTTDLLAPFDPLLTVNQLQRIRHIIPFPNKWTYPASEFIGQFPFEAYDTAKVEELIHVYA